MPIDITFLQNLGLPEIMLWLLTFAIVYGVLSQVKVPQGKEARAIIAIVAGFFVLLAAPTALITVLGAMSSGLLLIVLGIIVLMVFLEIAGIKHKEPKTVDPKTGRVIEWQDIPFFSKHSYVLAFVFGIIAILLFIGAGGMSLLGWNIDFAPTVTPSLIVLIVIILAVFWMIREGGEKK